MAHCSAFASIAAYHSTCGFPPQVERSVPIMAYCFRLDRGVSPRLRCFAPKEAPHHGRRIAFASIAAFSPHNPDGVFSLTGSRSSPLNQLRRFNPIVASVSPCLGPDPDLGTDINPLSTQCRLNRRRSQSESHYNCGVSPRSRHFASAPIAVLLHNRNVTLGSCM